MYTLGTKFPMGWTHMDEQWTKKKPTPNVRNVHIAIWQRIHRVFINTLSYAQNCEHAQQPSETPAFLCVPQRTANVYNVRPTYHERMTTYKNVHENTHKFPRTLGIRNSVTQAFKWYRPRLNVCNGNWELYRRVKKTDNITINRDKGS